MKYDHILKLDPNFNPTFGRFNCSLDCADSINRPHADYPQNVDITGYLINEFTNPGMAGIVAPDKPVITVHDLLGIHSFIVHGLLLHHDQIGQFRRHGVKVGKHIPPNALKIPELIDSIMPVTLQDNLEEWYTAFQIIHPFSDGNGRVGGIVYTAMKYLQCGLWMAPK